MDGSDASRAAVDLAAREAALRHRPLHVVHAFVWPLLHVPLGPPSGGLRNAAQRILDEALAGWHDKYPDVTVHRTTPRSGPRTALIEASHHAQLVIVGARGRGGLTGPLLGSVSQAVLHHATCPVAIVPHDRRPPRSQ